MKWRIPTIIDRLLALAITLGMALTFSQELEWSEWALNPFMLLALAYPALLAISSWWSLFVFGIYSVPASFVAYVWCDGSAGHGPWGIVHFFHDQMIPLVLYGLVRGGWEVLVKSGQGYEKKVAKEQTPASSTPHLPTPGNNQQS